MATSPEAVRELRDGGRSVVFAQGRVVRSDWVPERPAGRVLRYSPSLRMVGRGEWCSAQADLFLQRRAVLVRLFRPPHHRKAVAEQALLNAVLGLLRALGKPEEQNPPGGGGSRSLGDGLMLAVVLALLVKVVADVGCAAFNSATGRRRRAQQWVRRAAGAAW
eukprot:gene974-8052_t